MNSDQLFQQAKLEQSRELFELNHAVPPHVEWSQNLGQYIPTEASIHVRDEARWFNNMFFAFHEGLHAQFISIRNPL